MIDSFLNRMRSTIRGRNAILNVFELWVGLAGVVSGIVFFYDPASLDNNSVTMTIGKAAATGWILSYALSGVVIWYGLLRPSPRWEIVGLWLLGSATAANGIAIISVFGLRGVASAATLLALTVAAWVRALVVQAAALQLAHEAADHAP